MSSWTDNADLTHANSLGFPVIAERFQQVSRIEQLKDALAEVENNDWPLLILGGGSNLVLRPFLPGAVIGIAVSGINLLADDGDQVIVEAGAGENWHRFVCHLLELGLHGLENLALIPGSVGAAPVQNIGAYGVEVADCLHSIIAYDRTSGELVQLMADQCRFAYRDSLFKSVEPGRYIIWRVRFRLTTRFIPQLGYGALQQQLAARQIERPNAAEVVAAVCEVRSAKLPDPKRLGNAGSFFENPRVSAQQYQELQQRFSGLVAYPEADGRYKLAAGWLIDQAGWKGVRRGKVGVHSEQALVLVNLGGGQCAELLSLADDVCRSVREMFGVDLTMEPRLYPPAG